MYQIRSEVPSYVANFGMQLNITLIMTLQHFGRILGRELSAFISSGSDKTSMLVL
jgi:hypothetical protein